jgi:hypothetical protein
MSQTTRRGAGALYLERQGLKRFAGATPADRRRR